MLHLKSLINVRSLYQQLSETKLLHCAHSSKIGSSLIPNTLGTLSFPAHHRETIKHVVQNAINRYQLQPQDRVVLYCHQDLTPALQVWNELHDEFKQVQVLNGGLRAWEDASYPTTQSTSTTHSDLVSPEDIGVDGDCPPLVRCHFSSSSVDYQRVNDSSNCLSQDGDEFLSLKTIINWLESLAAFNAKQISISHHHQTLGFVLTNLGIPFKWVNSKSENATFTIDSEHNLSHVIIIGGSSAGLSAALTLGRSLLNTRIFSDSQNRNRFASHAQNILTRDGTPPSELIELAKNELNQYKTVDWVSQHVTRITGVDESLYIVQSDDGTEYAARKIILATGVKDNLPKIPGLDELWGKNVFHCPYCHGYEVSRSRLGVVAFDDREKMTFHSLKIGHWAQELIVFTNGKSHIFDEDIRQMLTMNDTTVIDTPITRVECQEKDNIVVYTKDEKSYTLRGLFVAPNLELNAMEIVKSLGCELYNMMFDFVKVDDFGRTSVGSVYAAGDLTTMFSTWSIASAHGQKAAVAVNMDFVAEHMKVLNHLKTQVGWLKSNI